MYAIRSYYVIGAIAIIPISLYPFAKRFTFWPQAILGIAFNWGVFIGWFTVRDSFSIELMFLFFACFFWTLGYDTIYAHQDKDDDVKIGVKSSALFFVITSYSIHYTKLYEKKVFTFHLFLELAQLLRLCNYLALLQIALVSLGLRPTNRITSYNVCYTKLLRKPLDLSQHHLAENVS